MSQYPKWYLFLVGLLLLPAIASPIYLFGGLHPFGVSNSNLLNVFYYVLTNLFWVIPTLGAFICLNLYAIGNIQKGVFVAIILNIFNIITTLWLF